MIRRLQGWNPYSNSSPVEGIEAAIRTYHDPNKLISIYVFGDDFTGRSIAEVVRTVERLNPQDEHGRKRMRIHGVAFPVHFEYYTPRIYRFAALMRDLPANSQFWAAYTGTPIQLPIDERSNLANLNRMIASIQSGTFAADMSSGFDAFARGQCATEEDAKQIHRVRSRRGHPHRPEPAPRGHHRLQGCKGRPVAPP